MKERPILFSAPMVRALLDGSKTQTRRVMKPQPVAIPGEPGKHWWPSNAAQSMIRIEDSFQKYPGIFDDACPHGQPGDRLWVRESFWGCDLPGYGDQPCVVYDDEWSGKEYAPSQERPWARKFGRIPSIHMPRDCSRILLEIVSVRVERLNDCSEADAKAEGVAPNWIGPLDKGPNGLGGEGWPGDDYRHYTNGTDGDPAYSARESFESLWESINGAGAWEVNPWCWAITFRRVTP